MSLPLEEPCDYWLRQLNIASGLLFKRPDDYGLISGFKMDITILRFTKSSTCYQPVAIWRRLHVMEMLSRFYVILLIISNTASIEAAVPSHVKNSSTDAEIDQHIVYPSRKAVELASNSHAMLGTCKDDQYYDSVVEQCRSCADVCIFVHLFTEFCHNNCPDYYQKHIANLNSSVASLDQTRDVPNDSSIIRLKQDGSRVIQIYKPPSSDPPSSMAPPVIILPNNIVGRQPPDEENMGLDRFIDKPLFWTTMVSLILAICSMTTIVVLCIQRRRAAALSRVHTSHRRTRRRRILRWRGRKRDGRRDGEIGKQGEGDITATVECIADTDEKCRMLGDIKSADKTQRGGTTVLNAAARPLVTFQSKLKAYNPRQPIQSKLYANDLSSLVADWSLAPNQNVQPHDCHSSGLVDESVNVEDTNVFPGVLYSVDIELPLYSISASVHRLNSDEFKRMLSKVNTSEVDSFYHKYDPVSVKLSNSSLSRLNRFKCPLSSSLGIGKYPYCLNDNELILPHRSALECRGLEHSVTHPDSTNNLVASHQTISSYLDVRSYDQTPKIVPYFQTAISAKSALRNSGEIARQNSSLGIADCSSLDVKQVRFRSRFGPVKVPISVTSSNDNVAIGDDIFNPLNSISYSQNSNSCFEESISQPMGLISQPTDSISISVDSFSKPKCTNFQSDSSFSETIKAQQNSSIMHPSNTILHSKGSVSEARIHFPTPVPLFLDCASLHHLNT